MMKRALLLISLIFGIYNCFTEIVIRVSDISWKYDLYYIIPIRAHLLLAFISLGIIIWTIIINRNSFKMMNIMSIKFNLLFVILWVDTMMSM